MLKDLCFEIIQKCPNKCEFCSSCSSYDAEKIIDFETFKKVIDHLMLKGGIEEISLSGGEPLLHPNLLEMISYCNKLGIRTVLFTSGIKRRNKIDLTNIELNEYELKIIRNMQACPFSGISKKEINDLVESGLNKIVFDFQSSEIDSYNKLMGTKNQWTYIADSLIAAGVSDLETDVHFIPLKDNYNQFEDIIELLNIAEIRNLSILNFVPQGRGETNKNDLMLDDKEMKEFIEIYFSSIKKFKGNIRVGIPLINEDTHLCTAGLSKLVIKYDGTVLPCPAFKEYDSGVLLENGIKVFNVYESLDKLEIHPGHRVHPLCKKLYNFNQSIK